MMQPVPPPPVPPPPPEPAPVYWHCPSTQVAVAKFEQRLAQSWEVVQEAPSKHSVRSWGASTAARAEWAAQEAWASEPYRPAGPAASEVARAARTHSTQ